jgi:glutaredoxin
VELDQCGEGRNGQVQQILGELTGRTTVPNAILDGKSIGGGNELAAMQQQGKLKPLLQKAGCRFGR